MLNRYLYIAIFAISFALILIEIAYTRIFSFKIYYYFTYLIIGISLLGLGTGGVLVSMFSRIRETDLSSLIPSAGSAAAAVTVIGYFVIASVSLEGAELTTSPFQISKLVLISFLLFLPFLIAGVAISALLAARLRGVNRLY